MVSCWPSDTWRMAAGPQPGQMVAGSCAGTKLVAAVWTLQGRKSRREYIRIARPVTLGIILTDGLVPERGGRFWARSEGSHRQTVPCRGVASASGPQSHAALPSGRRGPGASEVRPARDAAGRSGHRSGENAEKPDCRRSTRTCRWTQFGASGPPRRVGGRRRCTASTKPPAPLCWREYVGIEPTRDPRAPHRF